MCDFFMSSINKLPPVGQSEEKKIENPPSRLIQALDLSGISAAVAQKKPICWRKERKVSVWVKSQEMEDFKEAVRSKNWDDALFILQMLKYFGKANYDQVCELFNWITASGQTKLLKKLQSILRGCNPLPPHLIQEVFDKAYEKKMVETLRFLVNSGCIEQIPTAKEQLREIFQKAFAAKDDITIHFFVQSSLISQIAELQKQQLMQAFQTAFDSKNMATIRFFVQSSLISQIAEEQKQQLMQTFQTAFDSKNVTAICFFVESSLISQIAEVQKQQLMQTFQTAFDSKNVATIRFFVESSLINEISKAQSDQIWDTFRYAFAGSNILVLNFFQNSSLLHRIRQRKELWDKFERALEEKNIPILRLYWQYFSFSLSEGTMHRINKILKPNRFRLDV